MQGLLSADLGAEAGTVSRSFLLEPQGKVTALMWVLLGDGEVGMVSDAAVAEQVMATLNRFRIRIKAEVSVSSAQVRLLFGPRQAPPGEWRRDGELLLADVSRHGEERTIVAGDILPLPSMPPDEYTARRIRQGEPVVGVDVGAGTIPQETRLVGEAVSFTKGCYLGQELVARIDTRGHVNRRLMRVESGEVFGPGDVIRFEDREATVTSAVATPEGVIGLALVRREVPDASPVTIGAVPGTVYDFPE